MGGMIDITDRIKTLRRARARAVVSLSPQTVESIRAKQIPKGDVLEVSRAVALIAAKHTPFLLPFCHNIPITHISVEYELGDDHIIAEVEVKTIAQTGCEMEALMAAAACALNIYDMVKPVDKQVCIKEIALVEKSGGRSQFADTPPEGLRAGVLVISDSIHAGKKTDTAGRLILERLRQLGISDMDYRIVPDEPDIIREQVLKWCEEGRQLIVTTGGTGLSPRDSTPEAIRPLIEREVPGIMEAARHYGLARTPHAMLSRGIAGTRGKSLIITLPGSRRGVRESLDALFPYVFHIYRVMDMQQHD